MAVLKLENSTYNLNDISAQLKLPENGLEAIKEEEDGETMAKESRGQGLTSVPDISLPDKSGEKTGDLTMGPVGDISDIQPDNPTNPNNQRGTPGFKTKDFVNFYEGNSEDMSMLKDMTMNKQNEESKETHR